MTKRNRKLIGAFAILAYVIVYALIAMMLAQSHPVQEASKLVQGLVYAVLGLSWIVPLMPLIAWMEKSDRA
jgi:L-lactate permease